MEPMLPLADVIDFIDLSTLMRLYRCVRPARIWMPTSVTQGSGGGRAAGPHSECLRARLLGLLVSACCSPFVVWPSFVAHMTNVVRSELQKVLNHVEKVPTKV